MKRKPLILVTALIFIVGAALCGVNYRLNNPPLSDADVEFRALVAGANNVQVSQFSCQNQMACAASGTLNYPTLNAAQTRELIERLRFTNDQTIPFNANEPGTVTLDLVFRNHQRELMRYTLRETPRSIDLVHVIPSVIDACYRLHPRFGKPLRQFLDQIAPKRIRP